MICLVMSQYYNNPSASIMLRSKGRGEIQALNRLRFFLLKPVERKGLVPLTPSTCGKNYLGSETTHQFSYGTW